MTSLATAAALLAAAVLLVPLFKKLGLGSVLGYLFAGVVIGLILGIIFLHEPADWRLLIGTLLIVGGIGVVNVRPKPKPQIAPRDGAAVGAD